VAAIICQLTCQNSDQYLTRLFDVLSYLSRH